MAVNTNGIDSATHTTAPLTPETEAVHPDEARSQHNTEHDGDQPQGSDQPDFANQLEHFKAYLRENFTALDKDHNGGLDRGELAELKGLAPNRSVNEALSVLDTDSNGILSLLEQIPFAGTKDVGPENLPSGIAVSAHEVHVAAGASAQDLTRAGQEIMVKRYVHSLRELAEDQSGPAKQITLRNADLLEDMNRVGSDPTKALDSLKGSGEVLIYTPTADHALYTYIQESPDGKYSISIFNSGLGLENHPSLHSKTATHMTWTAPKDDLTEDALKDLFKASGLEDQDGINHAYSWPDGIGATARPVDWSQVATQTPQKSNDSTLEGLNAFLRQSTLDRVNTNPEYQTLDAGGKKNVAKDLYRTQCDAYLNQVIADVQFSGTIEASAVHLLEIQAARKSASNLNYGQVDVTTDLKDELKTYNETLQLARKEYRKAINNGEVIDKSNIQVELMKYGCQRNYTVNLSENTIEADFNLFKTTSSYNQGTLTVLAHDRNTGDVIGSRSLSTTTLDSLRSHSALAGFAHTIPWDKLSENIPPGLAAAPVSINVTTSPTQKLEGQAIDSHGNVFSFTFEKANGWEYSYSPKLGQSALESMLLKDQILGRAGQRAEFKFDPNGNTVAMSVEGNTKTFTQTTKHGDFSVTRTVDGTGSVTWRAEDKYWSDSTPSTHTELKGTAPPPPSKDTQATLNDRPSGIPLSATEVQVAAGANAEGLDNPEQKIMGKRYAHALREWGKEQSGAAEEIALHNANLLEHMNRVGSDPTKALNSLKGSGEVLIYTPTADHALYTYITETPDGKYSISIFNSGLGIEKHPSLNSKTATHMTWTVPKGDLTENALKDLFKASGLEDQDGINHAYSWPDGIGATARPVDWSQVATQTPQKSRDCTLEGLNAFLRQSTLDRVNTNPEYKNLDAEARKSIAQDQYRKQFGAYLNQVIADVPNIGTIGGIIKDSTVRSLKLKADILSAGDSKNLNSGTKEGATKDFKMEMKLYNEALDRAQLEYTEASNKGESVDRENIKVTIKGQSYSVNLAQKSVDYQVSNLNHSYRYNQIPSSLDITVSNTELNREIETTSFSTTLFDSLRNHPGLTALGNDVPWDELSKNIPPGFSDTPVNIKLSTAPIPKLEGQAIDSHGNAFSFAYGEDDGWGFSYSAKLGQSVLDSTLAKDQISEGTEQRTDFKFDPNGNPVSMSAQGNTTTFKQRNNQGVISVTRTVDDAGSVTWRAENANWDNNALSTHAELKGVAPPPPTPSKDAQAQIDDLLIDDQMAISDKDKQLFRLDPSGQPVTVLTSGPTTTYQQGQSDGSELTLTRTENEKGEAIWTASKKGPSGGAFLDNPSSRAVTLFGHDGRMEETTTATANGSKTVTDVQLPSVVAKTMPDMAYSHTVRETQNKADGSQQVSEEAWRGNTPENAQPGAAGGAYHAKRNITLTQSTGADGIPTTTETGTYEIQESGTLHTGKITTETAHPEKGDKVLSMIVDSTQPDGTRIRSESKAGQEPAYFVEQNGKYVPESQARLNPAQKSAMAGLEVTTLATIADKASTLGNASVAGLLGLSADPTLDQAQQDAKFEKKLQTAAADTAEGFSKAKALGGAAGSLGLYEGITGVIGLKQAIQSGDAYAIGQAATGIGAGGAEALHLAAAGGARLASRVGGTGAAATAASVMPRLASAAGAVAGALGAVAIGMEVPNLAKAIRDGNTEAIVGSSANIAGGVASILAGAALGVPVGVAVGIVIAVGVIIFTEVWNTLYNQGTPLTGPDPLATTDAKTRSELLGHVQTLYKEWDNLGDDPNADRFADWAKPESGKSDAVRAAAQFFVDHPEFVNWMDAAGTGDLHERDASYHGNISRADLTRYMVHVAIPPETFNALPPPSQDARLWSAGVIAQDVDVLNAFGKDGSGQASEDADIGLPELLNVASGFYDDTLRAQLEAKYPGTGQDHAGWIDWKLNNLKQACAYVGFNPSEATYIDTVRTGEEDNQLAPADFEKIVAENRTQITQLLKDHPNGMPSFNELAKDNQALGRDNPALWRTDRRSQLNADAPDSIWNVLLENKDRIASWDWAGMTQAREQALQDKNYPLYYALDYVMTHGGELFSQRGEGRELNLSVSDIEKQQANELAVAKGETVEPPRYAYEFSAKERSTGSENYDDETLALSADDKVFLERHIEDNKLDMNNEDDRQKLEDAFRERRYPNDEAFRKFIELDVRVMDTQKQDAA